MSSALIPVAGITASSGSTAFGPQSPNYTTTRPATDSMASGTTDTWSKDCSAAGATDGTYWTSSWFNNITGNLRTLVRGAGLTLTDGDDSMVYNAVVTLSEAISNAGIAALLAAHPIPTEATTAQIQAGTATGVYMSPEYFAAAAAQGLKFPVVVTGGSSAGLIASSTGTYSILGSSTGGDGIYGQTTFNGGSAVVGFADIGAAKGVFGFSPYSGIGGYFANSGTGDALLASSSGTSGNAATIIQAGNGATGATAGLVVTSYGNSGITASFTQNGGNAACLRATGTGSLNNSTILALVTGGTGPAIQAMVLGGSGYAGYFAGSVYSTGSFISSDLSLKRNVKDIPDDVAVTFAKSLRWVSFDLVKNAGELAPIHAQAVAAYDANYAVALTDVTSLSSRTLAVLTDSAYATLFSGAAAITSSTALTAYFAPALAAIQNLIAKPPATSSTTTTSKSSDTVSGTTDTRVVVTTTTTVMSANTAATVTSLTSLLNDLNHSLSILGSTLDSAPAALDTSDAGLLVGTQAGVIAQEVQALIASTGYGAWLVSTNAATGKLSVDYTSLGAVVAKGNQVRLAQMEAAMAALIAGISEQNVASAMTAAESGAAASLPQNATTLNPSAGLPSYTATMSVSAKVS